jgi:hypothetical protein
MNYSPSYRAKKLGEIQARLREVRFDLGRLLETAQCAEIRSLDEIILSLEDSPSPSPQAGGALEPPQARWRPVMSHAGCSPKCQSEVTRFVCWRCGQAHGETLHWRQGLPEFRDCAECLERAAAVAKEVQ